MQQQSLFQIAGATPGASANQKFNFPIRFVSDIENIQLTELDLYLAVYNMYLKFIINVLDFICKIFITLVNVYACRREWFLFISYFIRIKALSTLHITYILY